MACAEGVGAVDGRDIREATGHIQRNRHGLAGSAHRHITHEVLLTLQNEDIFEKIHSGVTVAIFLGASVYMDVHTNE